MVLYLGELAYRVISKLAREKKKFAAWCKESLPWDTNRCGCRLSLVSWPFSCVSDKAYLQTIRTPVNGMDGVYGWMDGCRNDECWMAKNNNSALPEISEIWRNTLELQKQPIHCEVLVAKCYCTSETTSCRNVLCFFPGRCFLFWIGQFTVVDLTFLACGQPHNGLTVSKVWWLALIDSSKSLHTSMLSEWIWWRLVGCPPPPPRL